MSRDVVVERRSNDGASDCDEYISPTCLRCPAVPRTQKDYFWVGARSADPLDIAIGRGQPNAEKIRRNLAGTVSAGCRTIADVMEHCMRVAGMDRELSQRPSVRLKSIGNASSCSSPTKRG
ncbi:MAG: hypothetical protein OXC29_04250 [Rhodococcus sp.]|nr:hypothetical protein [Rhodococcus sp. (in: high G+C Gram-positive bacteria)]